jgi:hypothetical protein
MEQHRWFARLYPGPLAIDKELEFEFLVMTRALEQLARETYVPRRVWLKDALKMHAVTCMQLKAKQTHMQQSLLQHDVCVFIACSSDDFKS